MELIQLDQAEKEYFRRLAEVSAVNETVSFSVEKVKYSVDRNHEVRDDQRMTAIEESLRKLQLQVDQILQAQASFSKSPPESSRANGADEAGPLRFEAASCTDSDADFQGALSTKTHSQRIDELRMEVDEIKARPVEEESKPRVSARVAEIFAKEEKYYFFEESVWDLAMFIGTPELDYMGSVITILLYMLNTGVQLVFCILCNVTLTRSAEIFNDEALKGIKDFRASVGHNHNFFEAIQGTSLTYRVCNHEISTDFKTAAAVQSNYQISLIALMEDYLAPDDGFFKHTFAGRMLVTIALLCWFLSTTREMRDAYRAFRGIISIKFGKCTHMKSEDGMIAVDKISRARAIFIFCVLLQRVTVSVALLIAGGRWLATTSSIENLLLNVVALQVVFEIDELIYGTLATDPNKAFMSKLNPVVQRADVFFYGLDMATAVCWFTIPALVILFYFLHVAPMVEGMRDAYDHMCAHDQRWTYGVDNVFGVLWTEENLPTLDEGSFTGAFARVRTLTRDAVDERILGKSPAVELKLTDANIGSLSEISAMSFETMVTRLNPFCDDIIQKTWTHGVFLKWIQVVSNNHSVSSCEDVKAAGLCGAGGFYQPAVRMLCNKACGCEDPSGEIFSHRASYGCGPRCADSVVYRNALNDLGFVKSLVSHWEGNYYACNDIVASTLTQQVYWHAMASGLKENPSWGTLGHQIAKNMSTQGCGFLETIANQPSSLCEEIGYDCSVLVLELCRGTTILEMRAVAPFCAWSCNCHMVLETSCAENCQNNFYWDTPWGDNSSANTSSP